MHDTSRVGRAAPVARVLLLAAMVGLASRAHLLQGQEPAQAPPIQAAERGTVSGMVIDRETGRPLPYANVIIVGTRLGAQTDLDGRFRIIAPAPSSYSVRAIRIGYAASQIDSVRVRSGENTSANFSLGPAAVQLQAVEVEGGPVRATSESALLALQKTAPRVADGIGAEAISRAPGSDAADAITRVTGVSVLDDKFVVVRGLAERYSNTLLNGVELTSPEPLKKIVPLDLFPASLIESIVTSKTATPDRPGDFAGGSVEIVTKEFPEETVVEGNVSMGYATQATFRRLAGPPREGFGDYVGFDAADRRQMPPNPPGPGEDTERFAEALPNVWTPPPELVVPDFGMGMNLGGRFGGDASPFGYAVALTYRKETTHWPNRLNQLIVDKETGVADRGYIATETMSSVDLGAIVNLAARVGQSTKFGLKNLYTRNAEELLAQSTGFETYTAGGERRIYQARYVTRQLVQTQLTGDHLLAPVFNSRLEWKGTASVAARDEPENRSLIYFSSLETGKFGQASTNPGPYWFRFLDDRLYSGQLDWNIPIGLRRSGDAAFKLGGLYRVRDRKFEASFYRMEILPAAQDADALTLAPEEALAPENIGSVFQLARLGALALPYESDDDLTAGYVMFDVPVLTSLRAVAGVRLEDWRLNLFQGTREEPVGEPTRRHHQDYLWSGNLTWSVTDRQNVRLAAYRTVARPDPRELSQDYYVAVTGDCANQGNPNLQRTLILNADVRWEFFPRPGELVSVSAFYKKFDDPIVELLSLPGSSTCVFFPDNAKEATNYGVELEARRALTFLPGPLGRLSASVNLTLVDSKADYYPRDTILIQLPLTGQSDYVANANLLYADERHGLEASVLVNALGERVVRYGAITIINGEAQEIPHLIEDGRVTLDAKIRKRFGGLSMALSGENLTDSEVVFVQGSEAGLVTAGYERPGVKISLGVGYAFR